MGEVRLRMRHLMAGSVPELWVPLQPVEGNLDVKGGLCIRWHTDLKYGAGPMWKLRAAGYFVLNVSQIGVVGLVLWHLALSGLIMYLVGVVSIVALTGFVSMMFASSVSQPSP